MDIQENSPYKSSQPLRQSQSNFFKPDLNHKRSNLSIAETVISKGFNSTASSIERIEGNTSQPELKAPPSETLNFSTQHNTSNTLQQSPYQSNPKMNATFSKPFMTMRMSHGASNGFYKHNNDENGYSKQSGIVTPNEMEYSPQPQANKARFVTMCAPQHFHERKPSGSNSSMSVSTSLSLNGSKSLAQITKADVKQTVQRMSLMYNQVLPKQSSPSRPYTPRELVNLNAFKSQSKGPYHRKTPSNNMIIIKEETPESSHKDKRNGGDYHDKTITFDDADIEEILEVESSFTTSIKENDN